MNDIYSDILIKAANGISGKPLINDKSLFDVSQVMGAGMHRIITIVFDETCADSIQMNNIRSKISEILRKFSRQIKIDISIISINESCIELKNNFQEYENIVFDYHASQKGLSPVLSAVYVAYLRNMRLKELYDNDSGKKCEESIIMIISDFMDNDNRYNGITNKTIKGMLNQINNSAEKILKIFLKCQYPNTKEHFSQSLSGDSFYMEDNNIESVFYWVEQKLYNTIVADNKDDADNPFRYNTKISINNKHNVLELNYKNENIYRLSDNRSVMPVIFVIDASSSIKNYADYIYNYLKNVFSDRIDFIDFAVMMIHDGKIKIIRNFSSEKPMFDSIKAQINNFLNNSCGSSPLCFALNIACQKIIQRIEQYKTANMQYVSPTLFVISDFLPNDLSKTDYFSGIADMFKIIQTLNNDKNITTVKIKCGNFCELSQQWYDSIGGSSIDIPLNDFIIKSYEKNTKNVQADKKIINYSDVNKLLKEVTLN